MGDKITRPTVSVDHMRARFLRESLHNGAAALSASDSGASVVAESAVSQLHSESPELQKAYLEQLVECAPEAISILDTQMRITRLNGEFSRIFGFRPEEALGRRLEELIVPPDRSSETRWIHEELGKGKKVVLETKRQRKDSSLVDVFISCAPVVVAGEHLGVCVLYRDISEQKRTEMLSSALLRIAEKASSQDDLRQFYGAIHSILAELMYAHNFYVALYDGDSKLLSFPYFVDDEDERPAPKKLGKGLTEYVLRTGEPLLSTPDVFEQLVKRGEVELIGAPSLDWLGVPLKAGGSTFGALVVQSYSGNVRFGEKEKEILTFVSQQVANAVEHKRNEAALRRSEARYRSVVQSAVYGIYRSNLEGRFLDVNPALIAMLGYGSAAEVLGLEPKREVFVDAGEWARLMREFRGETRPEHIEVRWRRRDEKVITVRLSGRIVHRPEESAEVLEMIAEDVTEQRLLENQFRQAQKMEAVGRLAGGVAHDFNNLLMVIGGYTEQLLEHTGKNNALHPKIEAIHHATERAAGLTRQLLAFSRKQLLELKVVDLNMIVGRHGAAAAAVDRGKD